MTTEFFIFTINIGSGTNYLHYFNPPLTDITVPLKSTYPYPYPSIIDANSDPVSVSSVKDMSTGTLPAFITYSSTGISINPTLITQVKAYTIVVYISDTRETAQASFVLTVTNQAPVVTQIIPSLLDLTFGDDVTYNLPASKDPEGLPYTTKI